MVVNLHVESSVHVLQMGHVVRNTAGELPVFLCFSLLACINLVVNLHVECSVHVLQMGHAVRNTAGELPVFLCISLLVCINFYVQHILYTFCISF